MSLIKKIIPVFIKDFIKAHIKDEKAVFTSQAGEDIILKNFFWQDYLSKEVAGFYIDIGAYHPQFFSNTDFFYKNEWSGINIDGSKHSIALFDKERTNDINIHCVVSDTETEYYFPQGINSMNSISENTDGCEKVKSYTLKTLLNKYLPPNQEITFMSIDTEGYELSILESNDWDTFRPKVLLVEIEGKTIQETVESNIVTFLLSKRYKYVARTYVVSHIGTAVFVDKSIRLP